MTISHGVFFKALQALRYVTKRYIVTGVTGVALRYTLL